MTAHTFTGREPAARAVSAAAEQRLHLVLGDSDAAETGQPAARMYVADDGGPIRTIVGNGYQHFVGEEPSSKTNLSNPYEGATEYALIRESEIRSDVLDYRTQAFRLRYVCNGSTNEWICDHLRQVRVGGRDIVEAIECKPNMSFLGDPQERLKLEIAKRIIEQLGWRFRVIYERDVLGPSERQLNFGSIYAHKTVALCEERAGIFERLVQARPLMTFGELRKALHDDRAIGASIVHALICRGRVWFKLNEHLFDGSPIQLLPEPKFTPLIRF